MNCIPDHILKHKKSWQPNLANLIYVIIHEVFRQYFYYTGWVAVTNFQY